VKEKHINLVGVVKATVHLSGNVAMRGIPGNLMYSLDGHWKWAVSSSPEKNTLRKVSCLSLLRVEDIALVVCVGVLINFIQD